ncbi:butyrophilin subfamily 1 member A1-like isoform 1-T4 [Clarias gariepinus]
MIICVTLLTLYSFMKSQSEGLKLFGPETSLIAVAGQDLVLPCFIKPNISAVDMTVKWLRLKDVASLVHLYKDHENRIENQAQSYRGRTSLDIKELQKGNASLKLSALRVSDEGRYKCLLEDKFWYDDITVQIIVEAQGSHPVITLESYDNSGGINLVCESRGWNPEPKVLWLDRERSPLPAKDTQIHRDAEGFSVKCCIIVYDYSNSNRFYCRLLQQHHMIEAEVIISRNIFNVWKWVVGISITAGLIGPGIILMGVIYHKKVSKLQKQKLKADFIRKKRFSVDVTLDPDTAYPRLRVSANEKAVTYEDIEQENLSDTPQRYTYYPCVLGKQRFFSGRFYYEVEVRGKTEWTLGVVRENIYRKEWIPWKPLNGFWLVELRNENRYRALDDSVVPLTLRKKMQKVGVFVDFEEGLVSFYDVNASSHIYSFTDQSFSIIKLCPFFCPRYNDNGKNAAPLIITALSE